MYSMIICTWKFLGKAAFDTMLSFRTNFGTCSATDIASNCFLGLSTELKGEVRVKIKLRYVVLRIELILMA